MEKTWKPTTAGILSIIGGAVGICKGSLAIVFAPTLSNADLGSMTGKWGMCGGGHLSMFWDVFNLSSAVIMGAGIALVVVSIIALIGGIHAIRRRRWGLALAGSILSVSGVGPLGVLAIIFVSIGKKEFK